MEKADLIAAAIDAGYKHTKPFNGPEQLIRRNHNGAAVGVRFDADGQAFNRRHQLKHAKPFADLEAAAEHLEVDVDAFLAAQAQPALPAGTFGTKKAAIDARPEGMTIAAAEELLVKADEGDEPWSYTQPE